MYKKDSDKIKRALITKYFDFDTFHIKITS